jgi:hypothetical protein
MSSSKKGILKYLVLMRICDDPDKCDASDGCVLHGMKKMHLRTIESFIMNNLYYEDVSATKKS